MNIPTAQATRESAEYHAAAFLAYGTPNNQVFLIAAEIERAKMLGQMYVHIDVNFDNLHPPLFRELQDKGYALKKVFRWKTCVAW